MRTQYVFPPNEYEAFAKFEEFDKTVYGDHRPIIDQDTGIIMDDGKPGFDSVFQRKRMSKILYETKLIFYFDFV